MFLNYLIRENAILIFFYYTRKVVLYYVWCRNAIMEIKLMLYNVFVNVQ